MGNPNVNHVVSQSTSVFAGGSKIGSIQSLSPSESLTTQLIRELDSDVAGEIIEIAIGVPSFSLGITKYKLYQTPFFKTFGYIVKNIGDITDGIDIQSTFKSNKTGNVIARTFVDGVIKAFSDPVAIGTILITESATLDVRTII